MDPTTINVYITLAETLISLGLTTAKELTSLWSSNVSPTDLDAILAEVQIRLTRRGIPPYQPTLSGGTGSGPLA